MIAQKRVSVVPSKTRGGSDMDLSHSNGSHIGGGKNQSHIECVHAGALAHVHVWFGVVCVCVIQTACGGSMDYKHVLSMLACIQTRNVHVSEKLGGATGML